MVATTDTEQAAASLNAITQDQLSNQDWWMSQTLILSEIELNEKDNYIWIGDITSPSFVQMSVSLSLAAPGAGKIEIQYGDNNDPYSVDLGPIDMLVPHEFVLQYLAANHSWHVIVDDVEIAVNVGVTISPDNDGRFVVYSIMSTVATTSKKTQAVLSLGTYT